MRTSLVAVVALASALVACGVEPPRESTVPAAEGNTPTPPTPHDAQAETTLGDAGLGQADGGAPQDSSLPDGASIATDASTVADASTRRPPLPTPSGDGPALLFSLSQGWANDLVTIAGSSQADAALLSTIAVLVAYQAKYDTYALVNPQTANKANLVHVLDLLTENGLKFAFDVYTSDTLNLGNSSGSLNAPVAVNAGMALWPNLGGDCSEQTGLEYYVTRYPQNLKGLRVHEPELVFENYIKLGWPIDVSVSQSAENLIQQFVEFAAQSGMWVEYNSPSFGYPAGATSTPQTVVSAIADTVATLMVQYQGIIYPTWPTNDGTNILRLNPASGLPSWESLVTTGLPGASPYPPSWGSRGMGLSDQSWMTGAANPGGGWYTVDDMPASYLIAMAQDAVAHKASIIQFEPYWYFFNWKDGLWSGTPDDNENWLVAGRSSPDGCALASVLGVIAPGC